MDQLIAKGMELINDAQKVLVFSGAGLSTESGIPEFRSPGGIWEKFWRKLTGRKDDKIMFSRQPAYAKASAFVEGYGVTSRRGRVAKTQSKIKEGFMKKPSWIPLISIVLILVIIGGIVLAQESNVTALVEAVRNGNTEEVKHLIEKGVDVNGSDDKGFAPLAVAAANGRTEIIKLLLDKGADIHAETTFGVSSLKFAAYQGHMEAIKLLLDRGARSDAKNGDGSTALEWAAGTGQTETVKLLLDRGADINAKDERFGTSALIAAARNGHLDTVKPLIERGADIKARDSTGNTAMDLAQEGGFSAIVDLLKKAGAK